MTWIRKRAPYILLVIVISLVAMNIQSDGEKNKKTSDQLKVAVIRIAKDEEKLRILDSKVTLATCRRLNNLQDSLALFLKDSSQRSQKNAKAIIDSPFSTTAEKQAATQNLAQLKEFVRDFRARVPNSTCKPLIL
jgi:hypothetical protein